MLENITVKDELIGAVTLAPLIVIGIFYGIETLSERYGFLRESKKRLMSLYDEGLLPDKPTYFNARKMLRFVEDIGIKH